MSDKGRLILAALLMLVGFFFRFALSGYYFMAYTFWAAALVVVFYWYMGKIRDKHPKAERILNKIASYSIIFFCMAFAITAGAIYYGSAPAEDTDCEYAVVLGAGIVGTQPSRSLSYRLKTAKTYLEEHPGAVCVVTGCQAADEIISEAECMENWLIAHGIEPDRIIKEEQARNTLENIKYSAELITQREGAKPRRIAIITEGFHMLRASLIAKNNGIIPLSVPARTELPVLNASMYIREVFALWKYMILG